MKLRGLSLGFCLRHSERPGFPFSGQLRASDSTTVATAFASVDTACDNGAVAVRG
jgi:hypothetical protein